MLKAAHMIVETVIDCIIMNTASLHQQRLNLTQFGDFSHLRDTETAAACCSPDVFRDACPFMSRK